MKLRHIIAAGATAALTMSPLAAQAAASTAVAQMTETAEADGDDRTELFIGVTFVLIVFALLIFTSDSDSGTTSP
jgi:hypothetical protein